MPLLAAAALLAALVGATGTAALWADSTTVPLGRITSGTLDIELIGETRWRETSGIPGLQAAFDPETFLARPGDSVSMSRDFFTDVQGDNMRALLTVDWDRAAELSGADARYSVRSASGDLLVEDVTVGKPITVTTLDTDNTGRKDGFTLEVDVSFPREMPDRFGPETQEVIDLGDIILDLEQVRTGEEFIR